MELATQQKFFSMIRAELSDTGLDTAVIPGGGGLQLGDGLRILLPMTDAARPALMDLMAATLADGADMLQYYTTFTVDREINRAELDKAIPSLNFFCPLGSFGVFDGNQLYHKYCLLLREDDDAETLADAVFDGMTVLYGILDSLYPLLMDLAEGRATFEEAVSNGIVQPV